MIEEGALLSIHDPKVDHNQIEKDLGIISISTCENKLEDESYKNKGGWTYAPSANASLTGADASIILTEWKEYENIDWHMAKKIMRSPSWIFDARSILIPKTVRDAGLNYGELEMGLINKFRII